MDRPTPAGPGSRKTATNGRDAHGRFLQGAPAGPGRPRKGRHSLGAHRLFAALRTTLSADIQTEPLAGFEDAIAAAELPLQWARKLRS
jgi:hypothetical protein